MLHTRDSRRSLVMGEHLKGFGRTPAPSSSPETRGGGGVVREGGSRNIHTATHSEEAWLFRKGCSGDPWHSAGRLDLCNIAGRPQTLERGCPVSPMPIPGTRATASTPRLPGGKADTRQSGGVLEGAGPGWGGGPRRRGRAGGRGPHSTLQQLMQPFWEP